MQVTARALEGGSKVDYLLLSVSDNLFHEPLDSRHLTLAAVELLKAGCPHTRIKVNLRLSDSTFARCVRLYESQWMLKHVEDDNLSLTDVHTLLEAAGGQGGAEALEHLKQDLRVVFDEVRGQIKEKADEAAERGKELKGPATKVKNYLPKHLIKSWVQALKQGKRVQSQAKYKYGAAVVQEKTGKRVQIPAISLPVVDGELDKLLEVTTKLDRLVKQLRPQLLMLAQARVINADAVDGDGVRDAGLGEIFEILDSLKRRG